jgi:hypothetical protein
MRMRESLVLWVVILVVIVPLALAAQVRVQVPATSGRINVKFSEPSDEGQADRLRELAARLKPVSDQLDSLSDVDLVIVHSQRELDQRLGGSAEGRLVGISYVHGILFLSPISWERNPTDEALEHEMEEALVRYTVTRMAGGNRVPDWLEEGLVRVLARRPAAPATAELVARKADLLMAEFEAVDPTVGFWAVRYLLEARGGLTSIRQLLRLVSQRPDTFVENLQLVYGVSVGTLERDWRNWLERMVEEEKRRREGGVREGPLIRDENPD